MGTMNKLGNKLTALVALTARQMRRLAKPKEGFVAYAESLIAVYESRANEWSIKGKSPASVAEEYRVYQKLLQMEQDLARQYQMVRETRALHAANLWTAMLDIYALARAAARNDAQLGRAIAGFAQFMRQGPRKKKPVVTPVTIVAPPTEAAAA